MLTSRVAARLGVGAAFLIPLLATEAAHAADVPADPTNYMELLATLVPGDVLVLEAGTYNRLTIDGVNGTPDAWITIRGPGRGEPAVIGSESCCNTVQLYNSSYVAIESLTVDAQGLFVDAINAKGSISHHIRVEGNTLLGFPENEQQIVGINTKSTAFGWIIRGNTILSPGTGLYLGNSDGTSPFIDGVVENNLVINPVGYCMQIKHQNAYQPPAELSPGPHTTVIRHNVFIKDDSPSPDGARPNLLVGGFPDDGPGSDDLYEIYGNFIFYNPNEALFQGTGRMAIHDNVLVGGGGTFAALALTSHQGHDVRFAQVYNNTIYGVGTGVSLSGSPSVAAAVGNLIFADSGVSGSFLVDQDNLVASVAEAGAYVQDPTPELGVMDFYPLRGTVTGRPLDLSAFEDHVAWDTDYNGLSKGELIYRGAYAGEGENPGCPLDASIDCLPAGDDGGEGGSDGDGDGGVDETGGGGTDGGANGGTDGGPGGGPGGGGDSQGGDEGSSGTGPGADGGTDGGGSGCGCTSGRSGGGPSWWAVLALPLTLRRRRGRVA